MCLILFAYKAHPEYKLVIAANRDEFYNRPTQPAGYWEDDPQVLAGRDLEAGGTWMGVNTRGELSMLTNYRDLAHLKTNAPSRGFLVSDFLQNKESAPAYLERVQEKGRFYNGFNLICGDTEELYYYGNYSSGVHRITPGYHGLSNALLNTRWPKVSKGIDRLKTLIEGKDVDPDKLFAALYDDIKAPDHLLPDTGIGPGRESMLSPMFIKSPDYGSRCSTIVLVDNSGQIQFIERTYNISDFSYHDRSYQLKAKLQA